MCTNGIVDHFFEDLKRTMLPRGHHIRLQVLGTTFGNKNDIWTIFFFLNSYHSHAKNINPLFLSQSDQCNGRIFDFLVHYQCQQISYSWKSIGSATASSRWSTVDVCIIFYWCVDWDYTFDAVRRCIWTKEYDSDFAYTTSGNFSFDHSKS